MFKNKTLLITGGTGSFGNAMVVRMMIMEIKEILVLGVIKILAWKKSIIYFHQKGN